MALEIDFKEYITMCDRLKLLLGTLEDKELEAVWVNNDKGNKNCM